MIVQCPSCGVKGELRNKNAVKLRCNGCNAVFSVDVNTRHVDIAARIWRVKGEKGLPVSLRVLKYRAKAGNLSPEQEISGDGKQWLQAGSHPLIGSFFDVSPDKRSGGSGKPASEGRHPDGYQHIPHKKSRKHLRLRKKRWKTRAGIASFAVMISALFFFPLSKDIEKLGLENRDLKLENTSLKGKLLEAEKKLKYLEQRLFLINTEFERVRSSGEEFKRAKEILEDIKKSIDSNRIYLAVSLAENRLYVKIGTKTVKSYIVSTGKGRTVLKTTGKPYNFLTPRGKMIIQKKEKNPVWIKPDWVWLEQGLEIPQNISIVDRTVKGELGKYRLKLGGGYAIHGTRDGKVEGKKETHGCIRMGGEDLKELFKMVRKNTEVYIY